MLRTPDVTYGSDQAGLVWGFAFAAGAAARAIGSDDVVPRLESGGAERPGEFLWLHFTLTNAACEPWLRHRLELPDAFYDSLVETRSHSGSSTRVELADGAVVAVLNDVRFFALDKSDASTVTLCATERLLVSVHTSPLRSVDQLRAAVRSGETFRSPAELVAHLLRDQAEVLVEIVRNATQQVDVVEDKLFDGRALSSRPKLGSLRRTLVRLQRLLAPEPAALFRLLNRPPPWLTADDLQDLRQSAEELSAAVADSAALVERVRLLQEELVALVNEQTNRTLFVLTVVTVLALPMTIIPGLFGMNIGGVPWQHHAAGFWLVVLLVSAIAAAGAWLVFGPGRDG